MVAISPCAVDSPFSTAVSFWTCCFVINPSCVDDAGGKSICVEPINSHLESTHRYSSWMSLSEPVFGTR